MSQERIRVYVWEFPVRLVHWLNVLAIVTLAVTGLYIGLPFLETNPEHTSYTMGWMRFLHLVAGYLLLMMLIVRLYWAFVGNRYASWRVWFPFTAQQRRDFWTALKYYLFISRKPPYAVGHTAVAGFTYLIVYLLLLFQVVSGFALHSQIKHGGFIWTLLGGWLLSVMHVQTIRLLHHLVLYVLAAFVVLHIYVAWYLDTAERNGLMGSIFGGYKFVTGKEWE
jgi:Ni/Fe-hydrogenase 1 B-type cytochrome subunit